MGKLFNLRILKYLFINLSNRLVLRYNRLRFMSNPNISLGNAFKLANYTTTIIHSTSKVVIGNSVDIRNFFNITTGKSALLTIGDNVFFNNYCSINCLEKITIGDNTLFGENVKLYDHNHEYNSINVSHQLFNTSPINIGENCWLGANVVVLKGVTIGNNVIIGAGCVIHKDVQANSIIINKQDYLIKLK